MGDATVAVFYAIFAFLFIRVNLDAQDVKVKAEIYQTVFGEYNRLPWRQAPESHLENIRTPSDLYTWITQVFLSVTFREQPAPGFNNEFCTVARKCYVEKGDCDTDDQCIANYTCGDKTALEHAVEINGKYWAKLDLQQWCEFAGTPMDIQPGEVQCGNGDYGDTLPICCKDQDNEPIRFVVPYTASTVPIVEGNCPTFYPSSATCCAPSTNETPSIQDLQMTKPLPPATVGAYNRVLMIRFALKRFKSAKNDKGKFKNTLFPKIRSKASLDIRPDFAHFDEEKSKFCGVHRCYTWGENHSYHGAGGYVVFINPQNGEDVSRASVAQLEHDGWFDLTMASLSIDLITLNGNVDMFAHFAWEFTFDFAGGCEISLKARLFNMNMYNMSVPRYRQRMILEMLLGFMILCFVIFEFKKVKETGLVTHFKHLGAWVDLLSLMLCTIVLLSNVWIAARPLLDDFDFNKFQDNDALGAEYNRIVDYGVMTGEQTLLVEVNLLITLVRAVVLAAYLHSSLGLMFKVLEASMSNLIYFSGMFLLILTGFVLFAYFMFGVASPAMNGIPETFLTVFSMLVGKPIFEELEVVDPIMAPVFFYIFYVLFYLVMLHMFVSILLSGYDRVEYDLQEKRGKASEGADKKDDTEPNVFVIIYQDLKRDIFVRTGSMISSVTSQLSSLFEGMRSCLGPCMPSMSSGKDCCGPVKRVMNKCTGGQKTKKVYQSEQTPKTDDDKGSFWSLNTECISIFMFMVNFILLMYIVTRGDAGYSVSEATIRPAQNVEIEVNNPLRTLTFNRITRFEEVYEWSKVAIAGLYEKTKCVTDLGVDIPPDQCNNSNNSMQLVQELNYWNIGFLNTTLVRLTIQPSCYIPNPDSKWANSYPVIRKTPNVQCASTSCVDTLDQYECTTPGGAPLQTNIPEYWFSKRGELGAFRLLGGFVVQLGITKQQCLEQLNNLHEDGFFSSFSASMVFEYLMYNGNLDMFTYNRLDFSLLSSGKLITRSHVLPFALNELEGGGDWQKWRIAQIVLFIVYSAFVFGYIIQFFVRLQRCHKVCQDQGKPFYHFIIMYYSQGIWEWSDSVSLALSIVAIINYTMMLFMPFRGEYRFSLDENKAFVIPNHDVQSFAMFKTSNPMRYTQNDWYTFFKFGSVESQRELLLVVASLNSLFISIKVVKYVGNIESVRVFSDTLKDGRERIIYFTTIMAMLNLGFALFLMIQFGQATTNMTTVADSFMTLFNWMLGVFNINDLIKVNKVVAILMFTLYMVIFYFVSRNMYLATMLNRYSETVGRMDISRESDEVIRNRTVCLIDYKTKDQFLQDVTLKIATPADAKDKGGKTDGAANVLPEVIVEKVKELEKGGQAAKMRVGPNHIVWEINGNRDDWRQSGDLETITKTGIKEDRKSGNIRVKFRKPQKKKKWRSMFRTDKEGEDDNQGIVRATVKNFWREQGAVTWIKHQVCSQERAAEELDDKEDDPDSEEDDDIYDDDKEDESRDKVDQEDSKAARAHTKRRLDAILFSRWPEPRRGKGRQDPKDETDGQDWQTEEMYEEKMDIDKIKDAIEQMPIKGEEAWLDCLITAIEHEMDEECLLTDVLRTNEMQDMEKGQGINKSHKPIELFNHNVNRVLTTLEYKARKQYYWKLKQESEMRMEQLNKQNEVIHEYVWELEQHFIEIMEEIHSYKRTKAIMLTKMAGILDSKEYKHLEELAGHTTDNGETNGNGASSSNAPPGGMAALANNAS